MAETYQLQAPVSVTQSSNQLCVERNDIVFYNVREDLVRIEITVSNQGLWPSDPTPLRLQSAPLGAFLPWRDLTTLQVPSLESSEQITLSTEVSCPRPKSLGRFDRVPPNRVLTALGLFDDPEDEQGRDRRNFDVLQRNRQRRRRQLREQGRTSGGGGLPADIMDLLGQGNVHWAGNINVLVGKKAVERHLAQALRIYPDHVNMAMFVVGNSRPDAYSFELSSNGAMWPHRLIAANHRTPRCVSDLHLDIEFSTWIPVDGPMMVLLYIKPPEECERGELAVHVSRQSTGEEAVVEFSLDPTAQGPGCYTL